MGRRIELPSLPAGDEKQQLQALYSYLYQMAEALNNNLGEIGGTEFTDAEMIIVREVIGDDGTAQNGMAEAETLKSLIIKTATFVKSEIDQYNLKLIGDYQAEGKLGKYVRKTKLDVDVTPTGIQQNYSFQEIIQGLKTYEINAKNYIKTGLLREVNGIPVYGVAIGKDVVQFLDDGTEVYRDENKVAELTADELSFYQGGSKVASYKGNRISFLYNGAECFYISAGQIHCDNDLVLASGKSLIIDTENFKIDASGNVTIRGNATFEGDIHGANISGGNISGSYVNSQQVVINGVDYATRFHIGPTAPAAGNGTVWFVTSTISSATWNGQEVGGWFIGNNESVVQYTMTLSRQGSISVSGTGPFKYKLTATIKNGSTNPVQLRAKLTKGSDTVTLSGDVYVPTATAGQVTLTGESNTNLGADGDPITVKLYTNGAWNNTYTQDGLISLNIESTNGGTGETAITEIKYVP